MFRVGHQLLCHCPNKMCLQAWLSGSSLTGFLSSSYQANSRCWPRQFEKYGLRKTTLTWVINVAYIYIFIGSLRG